MTRTIDPRPWVQRHVYPGKLVPTTHIEVGSRGRLRHGGEAWAFMGCKRDALWTVESIHIVQRPDGLAGGVFLRLRGYHGYVSLIEVAGVAV
ncbi:MAG: hypothetical protein LBG66_02725 [Gallionellaceae bacterium]|jgi:hypothetical protein|nr:hypothetical protein [Gallionellaceae bacterium]